MTKETTTVVIREMAEFEEASKLAKLVEENKNLDFEQAAEQVQKYMKISLDFFLLLSQP